VSTVYFSSPSGTAGLHGIEHARLWHLVRDITTGILAVRRPGGGRERMEELTGIEAPEDFRAFQQSTVVEYRFVNHASPGITWRGEPLNMPAFVANTAIVAGSDPVRLAVRMIEQCDDHCWVEGPDRAWLAAIIGQGLDAGVFHARVLNYGDTQKEAEQAVREFAETALSQAQDTPGGTARSSPPGHLAAADGCRRVSSTAQLPPWSSGCRVQTSVLAGRDACLCVGVQSAHVREPRP